MYHWSAEEVLQMPATRAFAMLTAGRELEEQARARDYFENVHISFISLGGEKYAHELLTHYWERANPKTIVDRISEAPLTPKTKEELDLEFAKAKIFFGKITPGAAHGG